MTRPSPRGAATAASVPLLLLLLAAASCSGPHHMLDAAGPQSARIEGLATFVWITSGVAYVVVLGALAAAVWRGRRRDRAQQPSDESPETDDRLRRLIGSAVGVTVLLLFVYLAVTVRTGQAIARVAGPSPMVVEVVGHQWWWEVTYRDSAPSKRVTTANELHIPVGRPVKIITSSNDVIHSLWVPNLHGKQDLIPGYKNVTVLRADREGVWRGECAEFCGHQHAKMALTVVAEPNEKFSAWYAAQLAPPSEPTDSAVLRGREVFLTNSCVMCHAVAGTPAGSNVGPDLTHFASRPTIAAGTLPNTRGHLAGWIVDPQSIKPGTRMPSNQLSPDDLNALLDYLRSLR